MVAIFAMAVVVGPPRETWSSPQTKKMSPQERSLPTTLYKVLLGPSPPNSHPLETRLIDKTLPFLHPTSKCSGIRHSVLCRVKYEREAAANVESIVCLDDPRPSFGRRSSIAKQDRCPGPRRPAERNPSFSILFSSLFMLL